LLKRLYQADGPEIIQPVRPKNANVLTCSELF
jgi:hypothetical protein